jgi:hypothetical protein
MTIEESVKAFEKLTKTWFSVTERSPTIFTSHMDGPADRQIYLEWYFNGELRERFEDLENVLNHFGSKNEYAPVHNRGRLSWDYVCAERVLKEKLGNHDDIQSVANVLGEYLKYSL